MKRAILVGLLLVVVSAVLGATVLREPIATAAAPITNVLVTNTATNPVPVREVSPSQQAQPAYFRGADAGTHPPLIPAVPAGKRLVITYIYVTTDATNPLCVLFVGP